MVSKDGAPWGSPTLPTYEAPGRRGRLWVRRAGSSDKLFILGYLHSCCWQAAWSLVACYWQSKAPAPLLTAVPASYLIVFCISVTTIVKGSDKVVRIGGHESSQRTACYYKWETENTHHSVFLMSRAQPQDVTDTNELHISVCAVYVPWADILAAQYLDISEMHRHFCAFGYIWNALSLQFCIPTAHWLKQITWVIPSYYITAFSHPSLAIRNLHLWSLQKAASTIQARHLWLFPSPINCSSRQEKYRIA